jgi:hypothetical protein
MPNLVHLSVVFDQDKMVRTPEGLDIYAISMLFMLPSFSGAQLSRIMTLDLFGVDKDYLFRYKAGVEASTGESLLAAALKHLHPDQHKVRRWIRQPAASLLP